MMFGKIIIYGDLKLAVDLIAFYLGSLNLSENEILAFHKVEELKASLQAVPADILITTQSPNHLFEKGLWPCPYSTPPRSTRLILINDGRYLFSAQEALKLGVHGLLDLRESLPLLMQTLNVVAAGHFLFCGTSVKAIPVSASAEVGDLSLRERQVLVLLAQGNRSKEIAASLGLSIRTVEKYRENLIRKTGLPNVASLTLMAIKAGLLHEKN
jgi:DNA-binding CsgD family transcriptional regulator